MKHLTLCLALASTLLLLDVGTAHAQTSFVIGPKVGYEIDIFEALAVGADLRIGTPSLPVMINPSFDYYFLDDNGFGDRSAYQITVNALYNFGFNNQVFTPYAGAGVAITRSSVETERGDVEVSDATDVGANLVGGAVFGFGGLRPFVQAQLTVGGDVQPVTLAGGLLFAFGR